MELGLVTYQWGKDWDLPTLIKNCEATGFKGVELRTTHKHGVEPALNEAERKEVAKRFADSNVVLVGLGTACEYHSKDPAVLKKNIEETKGFIKLTHDCGGTGVKVRPNGLPEGVPAEKTLEQIGKALDELGEFGEGFGMEIRLEVHGPGTQELPNIKTIMDHAKHPGVKVCWNCNPTDTAGKGLAANFEMVKSRLGTIHIHDLTSSYPWAEFFKLLRGAEFEGWTLLEEGKIPADIVAAMKAYRPMWEKMVEGK